MSEVWSIALTRTGIAACALNEDRERRFYTASWLHERVSSADILREIARALHALMSNSRETPLALALCAPPSAILVDENGDAVSEVWWESGLPVAQSDIPSPYAQNPLLAKTWRQSLLHQIRRNHPDWMINRRVGILTVCAFVMRALTGNPVDPEAPIGVPEHYPEFTQEDPALMFEVMGYDKGLSSRRARCGFEVGPLAQNLPRRLASPEYQDLAQLASIAVYSMGHPDGALSYATASNPLSWSVRIGWDLQATWCAGNMATTAITLQIDNGRQDSEKRELSADDWTMYFHTLQPIAILSGPGMNLSTYAYHLLTAKSRIFTEAIQKTIEPQTGIIPFHRLQSAGTGSVGLHLICANSGWKIIGLLPEHDVEHLARALLEGQIFHLRAQQEALLKAGFGPIRLVFSKPWPRECAQWVADILERDVCFVDENPDALSAFGAALVLLRQRGFAQSPSSLCAQIVEPSKRSAYYRRHYEVFCALVNA